MERVDGIGGVFFTAQLRAAGVPVEDDVQHEQGIGRFAWLSDPEGNRIELWEPDRTKFGAP